MECRWEKNVQKRVILHISSVNQKINEYVEKSSGLTYDTPVSFLQTSDEVEVVDLLISSTN